MINLSTKENLRKIRWALAAMGRTPDTNLNCLLIGPHIVGTDGHRLHYVDAPELEGKEPVQIPPEVALAIPTLAKSLDRGYSLFLEGDRLFAGAWALDLRVERVIDLGEYPNYLMGVRDPKSDAASITVSVSELRSALSEIKKETVVLDLVPGCLKIKAIRSERDVWNRSIILPDSDQSAGPVAFTRSYLLDALKGLKGKVTLHFGKMSLDQLRVDYVDDEGSTYTAAIMPMRLTDRELGK